MEEKILKIKKIKNVFRETLSSIIKNRNKKIEEIIKKQDNQKINNILNNLK
ncbi:MAG TPA: hypothetical protein PLD95_03235 [bacterium]|jgi:hypothetical protein|nr:hypothetical protein [bacterium]HOG38460.1 hypothetical protein [bacterium]